MIYLWYLWILIEQLEKSSKSGIIYTVLEWEKESNLERGWNYVTKNVFRSARTV